jgi:hypothetical protein
LRKSQALLYNFKGRLVYRRVAQAEIALRCVGGSSFAAVCGYIHGHMSACIVPDKFSTQWPTPPLLLTEQDNLSSILFFFFTKERMAADRITTMLPSSSLNNDATPTGRWYGNAGRCASRIVTIVRAGLARPLCLLMVHTGSPA